MKRKAFVYFTAFSLLLLPAIPGSLQGEETVEYTVLHEFHGSDGAGPQSSLISDREGNLYGTTVSGGNITDSACKNSPFGLGCGVVFKIDRHGDESVLYKFKGESDGAYPFTELLLDTSGDLYGTARGGGVAASPACGFISGCGVVFKVDQKGNESVLYSFQGGAKGFGVASGLVRDEAGNLYGTTIAGGDSNANCTGDGPPGTCGLIYKIDPHGNQTILHSFTGGADGYAPYGSLLIDGQGDLYGTASNGGNTSSPFCGATVASLAGAHGCGIVFKIDREGKFSVIHTFEGKDGGPFPDGWLTADFAGNLYGVTGNGGSLVSSTNLGNGTVFKIDRRGDESVIHSFAGGAAGLTSFASVIRDNKGNLYGATYFGGDTTDPACSGNGGCGVIFRVEPCGKYSILHTFKGSDGANPTANLYMDWHGDIYGTTTAGGDPKCNCGVVFKLTPEHKWGDD